MTGRAWAHLARPGTDAGAAALALGWNWRPEVVLPLLVLIIAYVNGQWRLARLNPRAVTPWQLAVGAGAIGAIAVALLSPLEGMADTLFAAHMLQHLLLIMVAAPGLLLSRSLPALLWGLPAPIRAPTGRLLRPGSFLRRACMALTAMPVAWSVHVAVVWLWHLPAAYDAAVSDRALHDLEHLAFFGSALLFWWPVVNPPPRLRPPAPYGLRVAYLVLAAFQSSLLGLLLAMSPPLYTAYAETAGLWGFTPGEDQATGGLLMWGLGGAIDMLAVLVLIQRYLAAQDRRPPAPAASARQEDRGRRIRPETVAQDEPRGRIEA